MSSTTTEERRADGRAHDQMRPIHIHMDYQAAGEGSVLIEQGRTRVLCTASIESSQPPHLRGTPHGWVTAEYGMLPRANFKRRAMRESVTGHRKGRTYEIERLIGRALRAVTNLNAIGPKTIYIDCDVLQADGGTRTASIIGGYLALTTACRRAVEQKIFSSMPVVSKIAAVSAGIVNRKPLLDLTFEEDSRAMVDMNAVWTPDWKLAELDVAGESHTFDESQLQELLALSKTGAEHIFALVADIPPATPKSAK